MRGGLADGAQAEVCGSGPAVAFARDLGRFGDRPALIGRHTTLTYHELDAMVRSTAAELGVDRRLVLVEATSDIGSLVAYLAALQSRHPVLLAAPGAAAERLIEAYDPDTVAVASALDRDARPVVRHRRAGSAHQLHPQLALLLSTSGTTGSAKLVRLSHENLDANAASIAQYLGIGADDRAALTLPMHYCYGLSVVHSHLRQGAAVMLGDESVLEPHFWDRFRAHGATSLAGVPYTFELLDRVGFDEMSLPSLRTVTQAGGRLPPERVRHYAVLGRRNGWRFVVMYGQTEATARMAYLPPELALSNPAAIGVPIPGGSFTLDTATDGATATDDAGDGVGELVYRGPNVMLGYAHEPADLARGREVHSLRTGDLARRTELGLFEIVGRCSRFVKIFGLRVDLDQVERLVAERGLRAIATGDDTQVVVAVQDPPDRACDVDAASLRREIASRLGLPARIVEVRRFASLPRLGNGKPDYVAIRESTQTPVTGDADVDVRRVFETVLQSGPVDDDATFVGLGGDSLSYVEVSMRLERILGHLPADWHVTPIRRLVPRAPAERYEQPRSVRVETNVVLRALAIALVVGTHVDLFELRGGAHVLLAVAGFNFARFQLAPRAIADRCGRLLRSVSRIAVPSMVWIGALGVLGVDYAFTNVLLVHGHLGDLAWDERWRFWYIESLVQILLVLALLFAVPAVRRAERRLPFVFAGGLLLLTLVPRLGLAGLGDVTHSIYRPHTIAWVFVLGWAAERAQHAAQKLAVAAIAIVAVPGYFGSGPRELVIVAGVVLLAWVPSMALPRLLQRPVALIAGGSLYVYLTHHRVYPTVVAHTSPLGGFVASLVVGIIVGMAAQHLLMRAERAVARVWSRRAEVLTLGSCSRVLAGSRSSRSH
jgi:acyl-CoA synthetase (AMP-forming)/AMP-acid ligase II